MGNVNEMIECLIPSCSHVSCVVIMRARCMYTSTNPVIVIFSEYCEQERAGSVFLGDQY